MELKKYIRDVPDFPKKGIIFKDITPLLQNAEAFNNAIFQMYERVKDHKFDYVVSLESRGFLFGAPLALKLGCGFIPIRKPGKLPYKTKEAACSKEYGSDKLCIHEDAIPYGSSILLVDDLLATGGSAETAIKLITEAGGRVEATLFLIELTFLKGREKLHPYPVSSIIIY
jgi:adenine phosphoribosyltransferase